MFLRCGSRGLLKFLSNVWTMQHMTHINVAEVTVFLNLLRVSVSLFCKLMSKGFAVEYNFQRHRRYIYYCDIG